jgi:hypothetical protein
LRQADSFFLFGRSKKVAIADVHEITARNRSVTLQSAHVCANMQKALPTEKLSRLIAGRPPDRRHTFHFYLLLARGY